jgi:UDP-N-acetylmuramyl pentapeptide synthase
MRELGPDSEHLHRSVGQTAAKLGITRLYLYGPLSSHMLAGALAEGMAKDTVFHGSKQEIEDRVQAFVRSGDWILVKGSRGMAMETFIARLQTLLHDTVSKQGKD